MTPGTQGFCILPSAPGTPTEQWAQAQPAGSVGSSPTFLTQCATKAQLPAKPGCKCRGPHEGLCFCLEFVTVDVTFFIFLMSQIRVLQTTPAHHLFL